MLIAPRSDPESILFLHDILVELCADINAANEVPDPAIIDRRLRCLLEKKYADVFPNPGDVYGSIVTHGFGRPDDFVQIGLDASGGAMYAPRAVELARILFNLRQRFYSKKGGLPLDNDHRRLVERMRVEVVPRKRPARNMPPSSMSEKEKRIARLAPAIPEFSRFQVEGWGKVLRVVRDAYSLTRTPDVLVIGAPTGSGKTEVFLLPLIHAVAECLKVADNQKPPPRFILIYPRVELLKDQIARIFRHVYHAQQEDADAPPIIVGFQFEGVSRRRENTLNNGGMFQGKSLFLPVDECPVCPAGSRNKLRVVGNTGAITLLGCGVCGATFHTSIAKDDHLATKPHIMVTTPESLDNFSLTPGFETYLEQVTGLVFDEAHVYHSLYGAHVHQLIRRIERLTGKNYAKIAASATIDNSAEFAAKLFTGGTATSGVVVHDGTKFDPEVAGLEILYFLQSPPGEQAPDTLSTCIQAVMAVGHAAMTGDDRILVFNNSLDTAGRMAERIKDAEGESQLWRFRTVTSAILYNGKSCPQTTPAQCSIYAKGECWRGIIGQTICSSSGVPVRQNAMGIAKATSKDKRGTWRGSDDTIIISSPSLEMGVDDKRFKVIVHYRPPRSVISLTQRRGRAGRQDGEIAYSILVLGTDPADQYYFYHRDRLLSGSTELPLNPQNPILGAMHARLEIERDRLALSIADAHGNYNKGIWRWMWDTIAACCTIKRYYAKDLTTLAPLPFPVQREHAKAWVEREIAKLDGYLNLRGRLRDMEDEAPAQLKEPARKALEVINAFLDGKPVGEGAIHRELEELGSRIGALYVSQREGSDTSDRLTALLRRVRQLGDALDARTWGGIDTKDAARLYDFFHTWHPYFEDKYLPHLPPQSLKLMLQALFYLHLDVDPEPNKDACPSMVRHYVPNSYFETVVPLVIGVRERAQTRQDGERERVDREKVDFLESLLLPYRPMHRYYDGDMSILDVESQPGAPGEVKITLRDAETIERSGTLVPRKVHVRPIAGTTRGIVTMCPQCYALHDIGHATCHGPVRPVKLDTEAIRTPEYDVSRSRILSRTLTLAESMVGANTVRGATVTARWARADGNDYLVGDDEMEFKALYGTPLQYTLSTRGIVWRLGDIVAPLLQDDSLRAAVESDSVRIPIRGEQRGKDLDAALILHTAAHLLHKAIAAISGVNEQELQYAYRLNLAEVAVWERSEGGAGISDIFAETLRHDPVSIYRELLGVILCPVDLSERGDDWISRHHLAEQLAERWSLPSDDVMIARVTREAEAERAARLWRYNEDQRDVCRTADGCPVCVHTTNCSDPRDQGVDVSRMVGEAIIDRLVAWQDRDENVDAVAASVVDGIPDPSMLVAEMGDWLGDRPLRTRVLLL